jgi:quercetin dioxygenase-like cupin family protein
MISTKEIPVPAVAQRPQVYKIVEADPSIALAETNISHTTLRTQNSLLYFGAVKPRPDAPVAPFHNHPHDKIIAVFKGTMVLNINGVEHELKAGNVVVIPALARHAGFVKGDEPYFGVEVCSPVRQDYVKYTAHQSEQFDSDGEPWAQPGSNSWEPNGGADLGRDLGANDGARPIYTIKEVDPSASLGDAEASHSAVRASNVMLYFGARKPKQSGVVHMAHNHPFDTLLVVLDGRLILEIEGERHALTGGSAIIIPAGAFHTGIIEGNETYRGFEVFAPVRRDYLPLTAYQAEQFGNDGADWVKPGSNSWDAPVAANG